MRRVVAVIVLLLAALGLGIAPAVAATGFVNFETPQVHPLDLSPDLNTLAVVNTADHRLLLFDVANGKPKLKGSVAVGLDPVSVRFRSNDEAWVVNQISDSVSVVDIPSLRVRATLQTLDEPADVVFAGKPERAFVSCSQANAVQVFEPGNLGRAPREVKIAAEEPRALAVSANGNKVYAAIFESGNRSTVLAGGFEIGDIDQLEAIPDNVVTDASGPYGGQNPPPNSGRSFEPPISGGLPPPPPVSLIVKKSAQGRWMDDNGGDWTDFVSGSKAGRTTRVRGWDVLDRDVAEIDAGSLKVSYIEGLMNINMALAVHPASGKVTVVGTDATNEVRFEPVLNGVFLRVNLAMASRSSAAMVTDLNPHLTYDRPTVAKTERGRSLGDPRGIVWNGNGTRGWVSGMGSNNVVEIDGVGARVGNPISVGKGPTGLALDDQMGRLYVLNRFSATLSVVDVDTGRQVEKVKFFDPTPRSIRKGRPHFYDTQKTSGLGHVACASCHVDARTDRLAWDLGAPDGELKSTDGRNKSLAAAGDFADWHPMKGPMTTQTMQDIIGKEPHHWRGDRDGLEEFNPAFEGLLGDDRQLSKGQMRQFESFLATIHFPPNPFRGFDNSLPTNLALEGHLRTGRFGSEGSRLPNGNAVRGLDFFRTRGLDSGIQCVECHSLPTGAGTNQEAVGAGFRSIPKGPNGEANLALIGEDASEQLGFKVPQLRNAYDKVGMEYTKKQSPSGFGFFHDGTIDSLARFVGSEIFDVNNDQEVADLVALMLAFSGSDLGSAPGDPPGVVSQDAHAAVGRQVTVSSSGQQAGLLADMVDLADSGAVDLVARGPQGGSEKSWIYSSADGLFHSGGDGGSSMADLTALASSGTELTFTVVPSGSAELIAGTRVERRRQRVDRRKREGKRKSKRRARRRAGV